MRGICVLLIVLSSCLGAQDLKTLILEYRSFDYDFDHGFQVESIACPEEKESCTLHFADSFFSRPFYRDFRLKEKSYNIINMSFSIYRPPGANRMWVNAEREAAQEAAEIFSQDQEGLKKFLSLYPEKLFVVSAGNGIKSGALVSDGRGIGGNVEVYPVAFKDSNMVTVAALNTNSREERVLKESVVAPYSNYSFLSVDIAASALGSVEGTSFAAPYVSRIARRLSSMSPSWKAKELKAIMMRACYIKDIQRTLWATQDFHQHGEESLLYQATYTKGKQKRIEKQKELGDVMLVKCGGSFIESVALSCGEKLVGQTDFFQSLNESCATVHQEKFSLSDKQVEDLKMIWVSRLKSGRE